MKMIETIAISTPAEEPGLPLGIPDKDVFFRDDIQRKLSKVFVQVQNRDCPMKQQTF